MRDTKSISLENTLAEKGATHYQSHLGLQDTGRAIKGLVVYNGWDV